MTASYDLIRRGARPRDNSITHPVSASADLELTGADPGIPSPLERIDSALRDPGFAAWVDADPTRADWTGTYAQGGWPGPTYPRQSRYAGIAGRAPNGIAELWLVRDLPGAIDAIGAAMIDPWTGEALDFQTQCSDGVCPAG